MLTSFTVHNVKHEHRVDFSAIFQLVRTSLNMLFLHRCITFFNTGILNPYGLKRFFPKILVKLYCMIIYIVASKWTYSAITRPLWEISSLSDCRSTYILQLVKQSKIVAWNRFNLRMNVVSIAILSLIKLLSRQSDRNFLVNHEIEIIVRTLLTGSRSGACKTSEWSNLTRAWAKW